MGHLNLICSPQRGVVRIIIIKSISGWFLKLYLSSIHYFSAIADRSIWTVYIDSHAWQRFVIIRQTVGAVALNVDLLLEQNALYALGIPRLGLYDFVPRFNGSKSQSEQKHTDTDLIH